MVECRSLADFAAICNRSALVESAASALCGDANCADSDGHAGSTDGRCSMGHRAATCRRCAPFATY